MCPESGEERLDAGHSEESRDGDEPAKPKRKRSLRRRLLGWLAYVVYLVLIVEGGTRLYWWARADVPFFGPRDIYYRFYPEVRRSGVLDAEISRADERYDVLLLGGSVLHESYGSIATDLERQLAAELGREVRVWNLADSAKTSRDSLLKYRRLGAAEFDLVVFYHGINDARLNNCPPEIYQEDYGHYAWFAQLRELDADPFLPWLVLPYTLEYVSIRTSSEREGSPYIPRHRPNPAWVEHGAAIKTAAAFRRHVDEIRDIARERGDRLVLMTFATHLPDDYDLERFRRKELDYADHTKPAEIWGEPENVMRAVDVHNAVLRDVSAASPEVLLIESARAIPDDAAHFDDCCHLTERGGEALVEALIGGLRSDGSP